MRLSFVTVRLKLRQPAAKTPCKCGSRGGIYTPEAHIAITEVYAENGVVYLKFKKPKTQIYEVMTLDMFLSMVYQTLERKYYDESY